MKTKDLYVCECGFKVEITDVKTLNKAVAHSFNCVNNKVLKEEYSYALKCCNGDKEKLKKTHVYYNSQF